MRIPIIRFIFLAFFILIAADLFYIQVIQGGRFLKLSQNNSIRVVPFEGARGRILDRNGEVLAESQRSWDAVVISQDMDDQKALFSFIASALKTNVKVIAKRYTKNRISSFKPVTLAKGLSRAEAIFIEENVFRFPGLMVLERYTRHYPKMEAASHITGYVGKPNGRKMKRRLEYGRTPDNLVGYSGVEEVYDDRLQGTLGGRQIEVNSRGQQTQILSVRDPLHGEDLTLTIDVDIQQAAYDVLSRRRGSIVVLDPKTGEILALVSTPSYDPNAFTNRDKRNKVAGYLSDSRSPLLNRAVSASFPPGSTFKIPVALAGLQERRVMSTTTFNCPGYFILGDRTYRFPHAWGDQDMVRSIAHSANEYFFHVGLMLGRDSMGKYARVLGLGEKTGVDLPYEVRGNIPVRTKRHWFKGDTVNMSIGQGTVLATPLQLARMMAVVETEGQLVVPHLVLGELKRKKIKPRKVSFRKDVWRVVKKGLWAVVALQSDTAHTLDEVVGVKTYGKTGTAQAGGTKEDHSWFTGVSSSKNRTIAYCVFLEHGGSSANAVLTTKDFLLSLKGLDKI